MDRLAEIIAISAVSSEPAVEKLHERGVPLERRPKKAIRPKRQLSDEGLEEETPEEDPVETRHQLDVKA